ncbi:MAG: hypothetical protein ACXVUL_02335, partial [Solirubrobacteraceae bacterium]
AAGSAGQTSSPAQPGTPAVRAAPGCGTIAIRESDRPADAASHERYGDRGMAEQEPASVKGAIAFVRVRA